MKHESRPVIHMEKQLGWAHKLGGEVSGELQGRSNSVSHVDGVSDMASACWLSLDGCGFFNSIVVRLPFNLILTVLSDGCCIFSL